MKLQDLTALARHLPEVEITGLTADSRAVGEGFLFAALEGTATDGRLYIDDAVKNGAAAILARPGTEAPIPVVESENPRLTLAMLAMAFFRGQPRVIAGVTGTNGKTSVARFAQQLWALLGCRSGSIGTLGAFASGYEYALKHTTPDPVELHQVLGGMNTVGTTHVAMEISSHGLAQFRADGVNLELAAFTNITRDHFDYHKDFEDYYAAKSRLFTELLPRGKTVIIAAEGPGADRAVADAEAAGRRAVTVGRHGKLLRLTELHPAATGLHITVEAEDRTYKLRLPMIGAFQAENALVAAGLVIESGYAPSLVLPKLEEISAAPGRMQLAAVRKMRGGEAAVYVDYAHTPAAIETVLKAIRPHTAGRLHVVLGAGGDRDTAKRPEMGAAAAKLADHVVITDDNPRFEDPDIIRKQVAEGAPNADVTGDRHEAILTAVRGLQPGDTLVIAGKGHERGQSINGVTYPFDDVEVAQEAATSEGEAA
ncbi:MAG: UDP-N-acetylmuramoyl-L-alanyl-D-glutamate--2,6-diaminopimelate ligase [Pseudomonadota bacterium]